jgi:pimeloyl-ACP methyl ester carboxylesterase
MTAPRAFAVAVEVIGARADVFCLRGSGARVLRNPLFLVHAAGGAARNFGSLLWRLGPRAVAVDLPGHGRSPGEAPRAIDESAAILAAVGRALDPSGKVVFGGHSMGAAVALAAAAASGRARVAGAVAIAAGARLWIERDLARLARRDFGGFLVALAEGGAPRTSVESLRQAGQETVARDLAASLGFDLIERARAYGGPLLVIGGTSDAIATPENVRALARSLPAAELVMIEGGGHLLPIEKPDEVAEAIARFIEGLDSPSPSR